MSEGGWFMDCPRMRVFKQGPGAACRPLSLQTPLHLALFWTLTGPTPSSLALTIVVTTSEGSLLLPGASVGSPHVQPEEPLRAVRPCSPARLLPGPHLTQRSCVAWCEQTPLAHLPTSAPAYWPPCCPMKGWVLLLDCCTLSMHAALSPPLIGSAGPPVTCPCPASGVGPPATPAPGSLPPPPKPFPTIWRNTPWVCSCGNCLQPLRVSAPAG